MVSGFGGAGLTQRGRRPSSLPAPKRALNLASSVFLTVGIQALDPISGVLSLPWFIL